MKRKKYHAYSFCGIKLAAMLIMSTTIVGCGGGSDSNEETSNPTTNDESHLVETGQFLDSAVAGLQYSSGNQSGVTDLNGTFKYEVEKTVRFFIGDIILGETKGKSIITPVDLVPNGTVTNIRVTNISRFLMTLDEDGNPDNGILIPAIARTFTGIPVDFDSKIGFENTAPNFIGRVTNTSNLASSSAAQNHLQETLNGLVPQSSDLPADDESGWISLNVTTVSGGDIFQITWDSSGSSKFLNLWLYVGGGTQWQHLFGTEDSSDTSFADNRIGNSYCFMMTGHLKEGGFPWPPDIEIVARDLSGNKSPCTD